jgi:undecaprenyl-diphosphatase
MPLFQVIVLGIVQGLTEFLPISSTAHLALVPWLFGWKDPGLSFDIALHVGTLLAVLAYFLRDWLQILVQGLGMETMGGDPDLRRNRGLLWLLAAGSIPVGIAGLLFQKKAESAWRNPYGIGTMLIVVGIVMWLAERSGRRQKDLGHLSMIDALFIGLGQALAVVPGTSRSGITISAGLFRSLTRTSAARFSFLLSAPAVAAAAAKDLWDLYRHEGGIPPEMMTPFVVGILVSAVTGALVIKFLMDFLKRYTFNCFVIYRIVFGIIVIALASFFRFSAG